MLSTVIQAKSKVFVTPCLILNFLLFKRHSREENTIIICDKFVIGEIARKINRISRSGPTSLPTFSPLLLTSIKLTQFPSKMSLLLASFTFPPFSPILLASYVNPSFLIPLQPRRLWYQKQRIQNFRRPEANSPGTIANRQPDPAFQPPGSS